MSEVRLECEVCQGQERFLKEELTYHLMSHSVLQLRCPWQIASRSLSTRLTALSLAHALRVKESGR